MFKIYLSLAYLIGSFEGCVKRKATTITAILEILGG
jgi:hypothetical protein